MISDFFYPNHGGVESHLYCLSQHLIRRGHKVVIVTHAYGQRTGIRYLSNGLKVYYVPHLVVYQQATIPTIYTLFPILRSIWIREQIDLVHSHQAFSTMAQEAILHARTMRLPTCFTDHSLFGFADASSIVTNKLLKFTLSDIDHVICVSHTSKENTVLRAALNPYHVSVIPNAVVASQFTPDPSAPDPRFITICVVSRLVYRKGMDLLVAIIPKICEQNPNVRFLIAGDGPKRIDIEQMRETYMLHDRVELLGGIKHSQVRNVLVQGQIFLNTSLTEAFCIGIIEAASCGLLVVSTKVGGVPEVLPKHMILFGKPEEEDLIATVNRAIRKVKRKEVDTSKFHDEIKNMYSWGDVAERTENVYRLILQKNKIPLIERLRKYYGCGVVAGKLFCILVIIDFLFLKFLEWLLPADSMDIVPRFKIERYRKFVESRKMKNN